MDKKSYKANYANLKQIIKNSNEAINQNDLEYIESNKPCNEGDKVEIILSSGRKVTGIALSFGILKDATVCITSYKKGSQTKYITTPHKSVKVL